MSQSFRAVITLLDPIEPGHPDNELPGVEDPTDPDYGVEDPPHAGHPIMPPGTFPPHLPIVPRPPRPPVIWPPSGRPDNSLPLPPEDLLPGRPDQGLPPAAGQLPIWPTDAPPGTIWPPLPTRPDQGLPGGHNLLVIVWVPTVGYRWAVIDPSLEVENDLPPAPTPK